MVKTKTDHKIMVMETLNPPWEPKDGKIHWKQILLFILTGAFYALFLLIGYTYSDSNLPAYFTDTIRIIEFTGWFVSLFFYLEIVQVATYKARADKRYLHETKAMQPFLHMHHNRSFAVGFFLVFLFYIVRLGSNWIWNFDIDLGNIFKAMDGLATPAETLFAALLMAGGFSAYAQYMFIFERVALGHKRPIFWTVSAIGIVLAIFGPYNLVVFDISFTSSWQVTVRLFEFSMFVAWVGAALVPLGFLILYKRYKYHNPEYAQDCKNLCIGFCLLSVATWFSINHQIYFAGLAPVIGGLPYFLEIVFSMFLGPLCNFTAIYFIRRSYYTGGFIASTIAKKRQGIGQEAPMKAEAHSYTREEPKDNGEEDIRKKRLQEITAVSDRISIKRLAILLDISPEECRKQAVEWAKQFNLRISGEDLIFNKATVDAFIAFLDTGFSK